MCNNKCVNLSKYSSGSDPINQIMHDSCGIGGVVDIKGRKTHSTVDDALKIVEKLEHRAGKDASGKTGDGVGILLQISHNFFSKAAKEAGIELPPEREYAVAMIFFPQDKVKRARHKKLLEILLEKEGIPFLGWRKVPINSEILGEKALGCMPSIWQCFVKIPMNTKTGIDFDRKLYVLRREFEQSINSETYVCSFSSRTIVYKGMFLVGQLRRFYLDLEDKDYESAIGMVHSRFSTNTDPSWQRAHPNRIILHNGEINTIRGNIDRMLAREETMSSELLSGTDFEKVLPVVDNTGSDSAMLDNTLEFLMFSGCPLPKALMLTIPEPWNKNEDMPRLKRDMYHYYATMMEPWDGPAAILFSDGDIVGATLDRNGLRPVRYYITDDSRLILSSEVGVLDIAPEHIVKKSRLMPGRMLVVDTVSGRIKDDEELKNGYAVSHPYGEWIDSELVTLKSLPIPNKKVLESSEENRNRLYQAFGYSWEGIKDIILPMAKLGSEPTASMGVDTPLAVLSEHHRPLFEYFKQMFAQVTNPPIDAIREEIVTDTTVYVGSSGNLLSDKPSNCHVLQINNPILTSIDLLKIKSLNMPGLKAAVVSILYYKNTSLEHAISKMFNDCDNKYRDGANIIILSDRGIDENHTAIPSLLAVSALEQYLVRTKKRTQLSVILESGEPYSVHHFATLLGFGAQAVNPYLAQECIEELVDKNLLDKDTHAAINDFNNAALHGVVKIASKMGISTIQSYQSAQIFEIVGISRKVVDEYFTNTISRIDGITLKEIEEDVLYRHDLAFDPMDLPTDLVTSTSGTHKLRAESRAEDHMFNPETILMLQKATQTGDYKLFKKYSELVDDDKIPHTLRGLLTFDYSNVTPISIDEVEPVSSIVKRFKTGAMSYGSISKEAHECLAEAMNRIGGRSNSGEGGETLERLGTIKNSAIKQVASGRFGVTSEYLVSAKEIQIKMAQGAKPGEGGLLPGKKVWPWIAHTRLSTPGVTLISPPPHHDIYSIEDLAQLIYDLKNANKNADISVKLASEAGVGTIACGVAKAGAQTVLISGYDGGTGAAPESAIHGCGLPWELGIAEAHEALRKSGLRSRVKLETDGKLMTGKDVAVACILGAEEFGFATTPLVTLGCVMMRVCNLDTCPMGIATQNEKLRKNFRGKPEYVINFMEFVAKEVREILASLGLKSLDELVGRCDLLKVREKQITRKAEMLDVSYLLRTASDTNDATLPTHADPNDKYDFRLEETIDEKELLGLLDSKNKPSKEYSLNCNNRSVGTLLGAEITRRHGHSLSDDTYHLKFRGGAGQSFGAFIPKGLTLELEGDSNDYFGKGLSGGELIVYPDRKSKFNAADNIVIGNVALYGATSGRAFVNGSAGERFCVRNSGATAVVEGVGEHGCEYMTGGTVVVLGRTGRNFAAGMSGGTAYVLDFEHDLYRRLNKQMVSMEPVTEAMDIEKIKELLLAHVKATGSKRAQGILDDFDNKVYEFKKIIPRDYSTMLERIASCVAKGMTTEQAELEAFNLSLTEGGR